MVSNMSAMRACSSGVSNPVTGLATRSRRGSPIFRISRTAIGNLQRAQEVRELLPGFGVLEAHRGHGLEVARLGAAVVARARITVGQHALVLHQCGDAVGELDLAAGARSDVL